MLPEPHSPRTGLALSDLQSTSSGQIGGGGISGLAIASHGGGSNWSTRGIGGVGAGLGGGLSGFGSSHFGGSGGLGSSHNYGGLGVGRSNNPFGNCGCSSSDYGLFKK